jgi:hypothetical protein
MDNRDFVSNSSCKNGKRICISVFKNDYKKENIV